MDLRRFKRILLVVGHGIPVLALVGCEFESSIAPIAWLTAEPQAFGQVTFQSTPAPSPVPPAPTPIPPPLVFEGEDSLDCGQPKSGDNHFGFCRIPGTKEFYVWGECDIGCADGPYPGIEIMTVSESDSALYRQVVDDRDEAISDRKEGFGQGGILGSLGVALGVPGVIGACVASGSWNFGTGCAIVLGLIGIDAWLTGSGVKKGFDASTDLNETDGLEESAADLFEQLRDAQATESDVAP